MTMYSCTCPVYVGKLTCKRERDRSSTKYTARCHDVSLAIMIYDSDLW
jgi:hypothetical protein